MLAAKRREREAYISGIAQRLRDTLAAANLDAQVIGRPKHIYSIYKKMLKYSTQGKELSQIYDLYALRLQVKTRADCYNALDWSMTCGTPCRGSSTTTLRTPKRMCTSPSIPR